MSDKALSNILLKNTMAIHTSSPLSLIQRKSINALLKNAFKDRQADADVYHEYAIKDLMHAVGYKESTRSYSEDLKASIFSLSEINIKWNILNKDKRYKTVGQAPYLASVAFENGIIKYTFSKHMRDIFLKPHLYARLNLDYQKRFNNKNSMPLWELMCEELSTQNVSKAESKWIEYMKCLELFSLENSSYKDNYKYFKAQVLNKIIKEINEKSDITLTFEEKKSGGKRVTELKFIAVRKNSFDQAPSIDDLFKSRDIVIDIHEDDDSDLINRMVQFIPTDKARSFLTQYGKRRIQNGLDFCEKELKINNGPIKNPVAFFKKAVEEGWVLPQVVKQRLAQRADDNHSEQSEDLAADINNLTEDESFKLIRVKLLKRLGKAQYTSWIHPLQFKLDRERILIISATPFIRDWIENKYRQDIVAAAKKCFEHQNIIVEFSTIDDLKLEVV